MPRRKRVFRIWKFIAYNISIGLKLGKTLEEATQDATISIVSGSWVFMCEGKTYSQLKRKGWALNDGWFVEE